MDTLNAPPKDAPSQKARAQLLTALLPIAGQEGFTRQAMDRAAALAGLPEGMVTLAAPRGVVDMLDAFSEFADEGMETQLADTDLLSLRIRERVKAAVSARLDALEPHKDAARRAAAALAVPGRAQVAAGQLWRSADRIWRLLGDRSTDVNYYTKRAILSGVIGSTMGRWLLDDAPGRPATEAFLEARIENVMQFEKLKARAKPFEAFGALAVSRLARWRYRSEEPG